MGTLGPFTGNFRLGFNFTHFLIFQYSLYLFHRRDWLAVSEKPTNMTNKATKSEEVPLEQRIQQWMEDNPGRAHAGRRMLKQLERVRTEFTGATAARLEALVAETLTRQLRIDESRRQGLEAAKKLSETVEQLTASMSACLLSARKAHDAAVGAAFTAMNARAQARAKANPLSFQAPDSDKKLMN